MTGNLEIPAEYRSSFTPAQADELVAQFRVSDADGSGSIDEREFRALLTRMGLQVSAAEADALVTSIDVNGDGLLDFAELVQMIVRLQRGDTKLAALRKFMEALDTTPVALLEREAAKFGLQVEYKLIEDDEDNTAPNGESSELLQIQLDLVGKVCGPTGRDSVSAMGKTTREAKFKAAEAALVKIKKLQPGLAVQPGKLPEQWENWLFANIERGASVKKLMHTLAQKGFLLTGNMPLMQRISTRMSSYRLRTKVGHGKDSAILRVAFMTRELSARGVLAITWLAVQCHLSSPRVQHAVSLQWRRCHHLQCKYYTRNGLTGASKNLLAGWMAVLC